VTSPTTPLISTQPPTRIPLRPMRANQPKKATMKSLSATVRPAPAKPRIVGIWLGILNSTNKMSSRPTASRAKRTTTRRVRRRRGSGTRCVTNPFTARSSRVGAEHNQKNEQCGANDAMKGFLLPQLQ